MIHTLVATGADQTAELQALYDNAKDGDLLELMSGPTTCRFVLTGPINWAHSSKNINVLATGAEFYAQYAILNNAPMITWGAPLGQRSGNIMWRGGFILGSFSLQNVSYSRFEPASLYGCLRFDLDTVSAYNLICIPGGITPATSTGPAIILNQMNDSAWANMISFRDTFAIHGYVDPKTNVASPTIQMTNKAGYQPGLWLFDHCAFEASPGVLFDVGVMTVTFRDCWFEGNWSLGSSANDPYMFSFINPPKGLASFFGNDYRCSIEGNFG